MSILAIPFTFSAGAVIIASQHNSNFSTIYNDYNGNIQDVNISSSAAISNSKLNLSSIPQNVTFAGTVNTSSSLTTSGNVIIGVEHQGDVLYDNGTTLTRLTPGTNGQFLQTQGSSANPQWATITVAPVLSNVIFQWSGQVDVSSTNGGFVVNTSINPGSPSGIYAFVYVNANAYQTVLSGKWVKISGVSTFTCWCRMWNSTLSQTANSQVTIGGLTGNVTGTTSQVTPEWKSFTIDVSSLTNGTAYDLTVQLKHSSSQNAYLGAITVLGS